MPTPADVPSLAIGRRDLISAVLGAALFLVPGIAAAEPFTITFSVERGASGPTRINGRVVNEGSADVHDVYVTGEALDASGKVLGRGIAFVSSTVPARTPVPFAISIPAAQNAASFRVRVSSFRHGMGQQAG